MVQSEQPSANSTLTKKLSVLALLSLVLSFIPYVGIALGILLGMPALRAIKKSNGGLTGRGLAIGGIVVACLQILFVCLATMAPNLFFQSRIKPRTLELEVKSVAHTLQLAIDDYKIDPKHKGLKPATAEELAVVVQSYLPANIKNGKNPFDTTQNYGTVGSGFIFGPPSSPGQVGYVFSDQREPYKVIALGRNGFTILTLEEKPDTLSPSQDSSGSMRK